MSRLRGGRALIAAGGLLLASPLVAQPASIDRDEPGHWWLTLQVRPDARLETLDLIARVTLPARLDVATPIVASELLRDIYGSANSVTERLFDRHARTALSPVSADTLSLLEESIGPQTLFVPSGPVWKFSAERSLPKGSSVWQEAKYLTGDAGPKTLRRIEELNPSLRGRLGSVQAGERVRFPFMSGLQSHKVRREFSESLEELQRVLSADPAVTYLKVTPETRLIRHYGLGAATGEDHCISDKTPPSEVEGLLQGLDWTDLRPAGRVVVAVLDSGIARGDSRFADVLWRNHVEANGDPEVDDDRNGYVDDLNGWDMTGVGFPADASDAPAAQLYHGTHVSGLLTGRLLPAIHKRGVGERLWLMPIRVTDVEGRVEPAAVMTGLKYARDNGASVVNLSFEGPWGAVVDEAIRRQGEQMLFVAAAGNGRADGSVVDLDQDPAKIYPARYGSELHNVITVAAHGQSGDLACFSNYGPTSVQIAAPGVRVLSTVGGGQARLSGTSQAAPLVTLTAAMLFSLGISKPSLVKERIVATADHDPLLASKVAGAGRLNIFKALSIDHDLIQPRVGQTQRGCLGESFLDLQGLKSRVRLSAVQKIIVDYSKDKAAPDLIRFRREGRIETLRAHARIFPLAFRTRGGTTLTLERKAVREIIPALGNCREGRT